MRYFIICRDPSHGQEKVYLNFPNPQPTVRNEIPYPAYEVVCPRGYRAIYSRMDIRAEVGLEPLGGLIVGGLLFLVDPLLGVMGASAGLFGVAAEEERKVRVFNESRG